MGRQRTFGRLTNEQRDRAAGGIRLAYAAAHRVARRMGGDVEDSIEAALYGLVRAAAKFSATVGVAWSTYCTSCCEWEARRAITGRAAGEADTLGEDALECLTGRAAGEAECGGEAEEMLALAGPLAAEAVRLYVVLGRPLKEVAREMGIPPRVAMRLVGEGLQMIRAGLEGQGREEGANAA